EVLRCREVGVDGGCVAGDGEESLRLGGVGVHIDIHDPDGSGVGAEQGGEDVDAGRLPGSVGSEQSEHLAPVDLEIESVEDGLRAERLAHAGEGDCGMLGFVRRPCASVPWQRRAVGSARCCSGDVAIGHGCVPSREVSLWRHLCMSKTVYDSNTQYTTYTI